MEKEKREWQRRETGEEKRKKKERGERKKEIFIIAFVIVPFQIWNSNIHPCQIIWHLGHLMWEVFWCAKCQMFGTLNDSALTVIIVHIHQWVLYL